MAATRRVRASGYAERILAAARELAAQKPLDRIGLSEVARRAGVSWPTVRRHVGTQAQLRHRLAAELPGLGDSHPDTRRRLLDAAARVFADAGYEGATLDQVAQAAGLTKGAVYWHFSSKRDVFTALLERYAERQERAAREDAEQAARTPDHGLEKLFALQLGRAERAPEWAALLFEFVCRRDRTGRRGHLHGAIDSLRLAASGLIRQLQADAVLDRALDPELGGRLASALVYGLLLQGVVELEGVDSRATARAAARLFTRSGS